ncbi:MAG: ATP-binding protein [Thermodesulfobacteriota bacterium]
MVLALLASLRTRVALLVLLALAPAVGLIGWNGLTLRRLAREAAHGEALRLARIARDQHQTLVEATRQVLAAASRVPAVFRPESEECQRFSASLVSELPQLAALLVGRPDGEIVCAPGGVGSPVNLGDRHHFRQAVHTLQPAVGEYLIGRVTGEAVLPFAHPLLDEAGRLQFVLVTGLRLDWLGRLEAGAELPPGSQLAVFDRLGTVLARYPEPGEWVGRAAAETELGRAVLRPSQRVRELRGLDGVERLYAIAALRHRSDEVGHVAVGIPTAVAYAGANRVLLVNTALLAGAILAAVLAAWGFGGALIVRPARALARAARALGEGDLSARTRLAGAPGELGEVARAFDRMAEDVERRERERREREATLRALLDGNPETLLLVSAQGRILAVNETGARRLGAPREELLGRDVHGLFSPEVAARRRERFAEAVRTRRPVRFEDERSGRTYEQVLQPVLDEAGGVVSLAILAIDVTERKRTQEELNRSQEQLAQAQRLEAVGLLAGGIAHDFNNLLQVVLGRGELALARLAPENPARADLGEMVQAALRAASLTRQLLAFSRRQVLQPRVLDLNAVVAGIQTMIRRLIGEDIAVEALLNPDLGRTLADPGQVEQILVNLALNARDAMPRGGKLTISTANADLDEAYARLHPELAPGPYVMLAVSDTGQGMPPEVVARLFEPFFTTKEQGRGTGLGLATVYGIVKQSGGHIAVYSEPGTGTAFKVYLPRAAEDAGAPAPDPKPEETPVSGTGTVLVVEDEDPVRATVRQVLAALGYTVHDARTPDDAFLLAGGLDRLDLLITDVILPGMSGRDVAERLRKERPGLRVLYVSGYTDDAIVRHGVLDPGLAFLQKPFTRDALARKVREVLGA